MSQRRSNAQIALFVIFTAVFIGLIGLGQGLQCYTCNSIYHNDCANPTSSRLQQCNLTTDASEALTNPITDDFNVFVASTNALNITFQCYTLRLGIHNETKHEDLIDRGCTPFEFGCDKMTQNLPKDIMITSCDIDFCQTDQCNSSSMVKIGMISLLLPLITILLRIR